MNTDRMLIGMVFMLMMIAMVMGAMLHDLHKENRGLMRQNQLLQEHVRLHQELNDKALRVSEIHEKISVGYAKILLDMTKQLGVKSHPAVTMAKARYGIGGALE